MDYVVEYFNEIKKDYPKMKEACAQFEQESEAFCRRIGLDMDAFNMEMNPDHPDEAIFHMPKLTERDLAMLGAYLANREKMYILETGVSNIADEELRYLVGAYYLQGKKQATIASEIGHTKSYVSKKLNEAESTMLEAIRSYLDWKYNVPGGRDCPWAGQWENRYMREQDVRNNKLRMPDLSKMPWMNTLHKMGL